MNQELISGTCPKCGKQFRIPSELAGKRVVCNGCKTRFVVQAGKPAAVAKAAAAPASPTAQGPPPTGEDELIPFDEAAGGSTETTISTRARLQPEKVKIQATGHYYVGKVVLAGKMLHVTIEKALNEYAAEGWRVQHILNTGNEAYFIMTQEVNGQPKEEPTTPEPKPS